MRGPNALSQIDSRRGGSRRTLCFAAIIAVGFALRFVGIESRSLWGDEGLTLLIAQRSLVALFLAPFDPTPGLYYLLHKLLIGPDAGVLAVRSISLIAGTAAIAALYVTARFSRVPALFAALLIALSFPLIDYSQEARAYSLSVLMILLSGCALIWWDRTRRLPAMLAFAAFTTLSFYTHFVSVFWIIPAVAGFITLALRDGDGRRQVGLVLILMVLLAAPEAYRLLHYQRDSFTWIPQASPMEAVTILSYTQLPFGLFENDRWHLGRELTAIASVMCYGLLGLLAVRHRRKLKQWAYENQAAAIFVLIGLSAPIAIWLFGYVATAIFMPRTTLIGVPGFILAVALLLKFEHRPARFLIVGLFAISLALTGTVRPKEDWRPVAHLLESRVRWGDVVILCASWKAMAFRHAIRTRVDAPLLIVGTQGTFLIEQNLGSSRFWAKNYAQVLNARSGSAEAQAALRNSNRIWRINSGCAD